MTPNVKFKTVTELSRKGTAIVAEIEDTGKAVIITKSGKPVALLKEVTPGSKGKTETISNLRNNALAVIAELQKTGKQLIITRDNEPVVILQRIKDEIISIE